jgi:hypothetical protein
MSRGLFNIAAVYFLAATTVGLAQETPTTPAASRSEADCTGYIAQTPVPAEIYVFGGEDDYFHSPVRLFATGDSVFLHARGTTPLAPGAEYALVRPAKYLFEIPRYDGEHRAIRQLGTPYEDVGRVKVTRVTPEGAIAEVTFACGPVSPGDLAVPYKVRTIPEYTPSQHFDRFVPHNGKLVGAITAAKNNAETIGTGSIAYLNLGENYAVKPGQRYRIFNVPASYYRGFLVYPPTPRESLGELVVLSTQEKSSVGIIVSSTREVALGDGVELE